MTDVDLVDRITSTLAADRDEFNAAVGEERNTLLSELEAGTFDNPQANIGLEYEFYAVASPETDHHQATTDGGGHLARVPRQLLSMISLEKELGLHNTELSTTPQPLNEYGLRAQQLETSARVYAAQQLARVHGIDLASDGMWTIPPAGETAREYLTATATEDGICIATNMSDSVRYHAMTNADVPIGTHIRAPNVSLETETVMPESLITSIQPHYQLPQAADLPHYFTYALRIAGPLLALSANSPFFPPDLYDDGVTLETVLADGWMEHRIPVFETALNDPKAAAGKVRFPMDLGSLAEAVDRLVADEPLLVPDPEETGRFDDAFAHLRHKHGTYWRWVRPVFDGPSRAAANVRIEFRPISSQPTVADTIAFQAAFAGLLEAMPRAEHPVRSLNWHYARENFYAAMRDGLDADLRWITNDGLETQSNERIYRDVLLHAEEGLRGVGISTAVIEQLLQPLWTRVETRTTPASWIRARARAAGEDGADIEAAITTAKREYLRHQRETFHEGSFADWPGVE